MKANYTVQSRDTKMYNALNFTDTVYNYKNRRNKTRVEKPHIAKNTQNHRTVAQYTV